MIILMVLSTISLVTLGLDFLLGWDTKFANPFFLWLTILILSYNVYTLQKDLIDDYS